MVIFSPQHYALGCGLACIAYLTNITQADLLQQNPDILSFEKLQFIGLFVPEIITLLSRYGKSYEWKEQHINQGEILSGSIVYIEQLDHYMVKLGDKWADPHIHLKGYPEFGYRDALPYQPSCIISPRE